jgi:sialidase-1
VVKRSLDNGNTWSALSVLYSNSTADDTNVIGNAAPVQDSTTGRIWMPFCRNNEEVWLSYSDDDGVSWSTPTFQPHLSHSDWKWIGLGPPGSIQLSTGRLLIPAYHTIKWKGDGCASRGHTIYSDDHGVTWAIGSEDFGRPFLANECQAVELKNGSVLINARTVTNLRIQVISNDGGLTFGEPYVPTDLHQPLEGCEGSLVRDPVNDVLYFSDPYSTSVIRMNMTIFASKDNGLTWNHHVTVDRGAVSYSSMQMIPETNEVEILYERSNVTQLVFDPDEIVYWKVPKDL